MMCKLKLGMHKDGLRWEGIMKEMKGWMEKVAL